MKPGTKNRPLRVAVIGSGPAGFYTAQHLFLADGLSVTVDMFERLPAPYGLVRYGVAPDHPKIKSVTSVYDKLATDPRFRLFGNVEYGCDVTLEELRAHYDQLVFATGAQTDRSLGIPGEELAGSHPATEFVAWYNGHPDFADRQFDLSHRRAVVIGVGNVAVDVARILCRTIEELRQTDIADHALEALKESAVEEVLLVGRRGPAQAAFTNPEAKELGQLQAASAVTLPEEVALDPVSRALLEQKPDRNTSRKLEILESYARPAAAETKPRRLVIRFLRSPVEILGDDDGRVRAVRLVRNEIQDDDGWPRAQATDDHETIETGLVFRSVGYRGVPLADLPFDDRRGLVPNDGGRVLDGEQPITGLYVSGWIKRGPTGVIGTNKADAGETVRAMLEDLAVGRSLTPSDPTTVALPRLLEQRGVRTVSYEQWCAIDRAEVERGRADDRPRVKLIRLEEFLSAIDSAARAG